MIVRGLLLFVISSCSATLVVADETPAFADDQIKLFETQVIGILEANCLKCHGGAKPKGGLDLTRRHGILTGGDSGAANSLCLAPLHWYGGHAYRAPPLDRIHRSASSARLRSVGSVQLLRTRFRSQELLRRERKEEGELTDLRAARVLRALADELEGRAG